MGSKVSIPALREQAMEALEESTKMLEVASNLLDQGNKEEAIRLTDEARAKRNVSVWLMSKANALEINSSQEARPRHYETHGSTPQVWRRQTGELHRNH
jgi:primosomal protein N'